MEVFNYFQQSKISKPSDVGLVTDHAKNNLKLCFSSKSRQASNDFRPAANWKRGHERHGSNISRKSLVAIASYNNAVRVAAESGAISPLPPPPGGGPGSPPFMEAYYSRFYAGAGSGKECGFGSCRPAFLQRFANIKVS